MTSFVSSAEKRKWSCVLGHELYRKIYIHCPTEKNKKKGKCDEVNFQHDSSSTNVFIFLRVGPKHPNYSDESALPLSPIFLFVSDCFVLLCMCACMYPCVISVSWSVICCQDGCSTALAKGALPEEYLSHNFDEQCLGGH